MPRHPWLHAVRQRFRTEVRPNDSVPAQYYDPVKCARNPKEIVGVLGEDSSIPVYFTACGEAFS